MGLKLVENTKTDADVEADRVAERLGLLLDMREIDQKIEHCANRAFESDSIGIRKLRRVNEHLMDAKKSIRAAIKRFANVRG